MPDLGLLVRKTAVRLETAGIGDARLEADLIWMTALGVDRAHLYAAFNEPVPEDGAERAAELMARRLAREPVAYLMGKREFYGVEIVVGPGVLIPRPDTETVVEETLRLIERIDAPCIADVGCGSGAIAVALAVTRADATVYALDVAPRALELTVLNADANGVSDRVQVIASDLLSALPGPVHAIAANLPYVRSDELPTLDPEVRLFEPREALDGGDDGLSLVRRLLAEAGACLYPGGSVVMEMDPRQIEAASQTAAVCLPSAKTRVVHDLAGRERVLVVET